MEAVWAAISGVSLQIAQCCPRRDCQIRAEINNVADAAAHVTPCCNA